MVSEFFYFLFRKCHKLTLFTFNFNYYHNIENNISYSTSRSENSVKFQKSANIFKIYVQGIRYDTPNTKNNNISIKMHQIATKMI